MIFSSYLNNKNQFIGHSSHFPTYLSVALTLTCVLSLVGASLWLSVWFCCGVPALSVLMTGLVAGYIISSVIFYTPFGMLCFVIHIIWYAVFLFCMLSFILDTIWYNVFYSTHHLVCCISFYTPFGTLCFVLYTILYVVFYSTHHLVCGVLFYKLFHIESLHVFNTQHIINTVL